MVLLGVEQAGHLAQDEERLGARGRQLPYGHRVSLEARDKRVGHRKGQWYLGILLMGRSAGVSAMTGLTGSRHSPQDAMRTSCFGAGQNIMFKVPQT